MPQPPIDPTALLNAIIVPLHAIAAFVVANPLIGLFALAAAAILSRIDPIIALAVLLLAVAYFVH